MNRRVILFLALLVPLSVVHGQPECGETRRCLSNIEPFQGHGPASSLPAVLCTTCAGNNRRVVTVRIVTSNGTDPSGTSWDYNPSGTLTPGHTNTHVWDAVNCAINQWNSAGIGYYLVLDQGGHVSGPADITVSRSTTLSTYAFSGMTPGTSNRQDSIILRSDNGNLGGGNFNASDLCGRVAHELGHHLGLVERGPCITSGSESIMSGVNANGTRPVDNVNTRDVQQVNSHFASRSNCDYTNPNPNEEPVGGDGGDPCNGDPCCGDPCCGDPCCGDPCCGDPCCGDPNCGQECYEVCTSYCYSACTAYDDYGDCYWWEYVCEESCETQCF